MRITTLAKLAGSIVAVGFCLVIASGWFALRELKVNGPLYDRVVQGKDLVADILPPPAYIIEAYLEVNLLLQDPATVAEREKRIATLRSEYGERHDFWQKSDLPQEIRAKFLVEAHQPAMAFWTAVATRFIPALRAGDTAGARDIMRDLRALYARHRAAVDEVVKLANARNAATEAEAQRVEHVMSIVMIAAGLFGIAVVSLCVWGLNGRLVQPLLAMQAAMTDLARGNLEVAIPATGRTDEIGEMAASVAIFRDAARHREEMEADAARKRQELEAERAGREREKAEADKSQIETLRNMADKVEHAARRSVAVVAEKMDSVTDMVGSLAQSAAGLSDNCEGVAAAADEALATMRQTSHSTAALTGAIQSVVTKAANAQDANTRAVQASQAAGSRIRSLADTITQIEGFTQTINDIARNTSLLALNAGVEAARSGEHGRGFAVIAQEVKALSEQTSQATGKINELIRAVQAAKDGALDAVGDIGQAIERANTMAVEIGSALREQAKAVDDIAHNVAETERAASDVAVRIQSVASETQAAGEQSRQADAICASVAEQVLALQRELIASLRTSSPHVDRREEERQVMRANIAVETATGSHHVALLNLTAKGAMVAGEMGPEGTRMTLTLPDGRTRVGGMIVHADAKSTSIAFDHPLEALQAHALPRAA